MARAAAAEQESRMDPELWGNLQYHVDLEMMIFAKLPFRHFFQLRCVCKEWNRLASDAAFLNYIYKDSLLPEPYFVLNPEGHDKVCGLLARDQRTQQWTWTRLPNGSAGSRFVFDDFYSTAGLALSDFLDDQESRFVFNLHTRHLLLLPPPPEQTRFLNPYIGMEVDTAARPYQFKIMTGNPDVVTQIYDSRTSTWSAKASQVGAMYRGQVMAAFAKGVFIFSCEAYIVVIYDTARDVWAEYDPPPDGDCGDFARGFGAWRDRILRPSCDTRGMIRVWELTSITEWDWKEVATMPGDLCSWLLYENNEPPVDSGLIQIIASYCFQSILIYAWRNIGEASDEDEDASDEDYYTNVVGAERFVIFDLEKMEFRKLELPFGLLNHRLPSHGDLYAVW